MTTVTILALAVLLLVLFLVPGWLWLRRAGVEPMLALYAGPGVVAAVAAVIVTLGVLLPWKVGTTCIGGGVLIVATSAWCAITAPRPLLPPHRECAAIAVLVVAFLSLVAFAAPPSDPYGLWGPTTVGPGRVDTPRWPGLPSDNTFPYRAAQVAFFKQGGEHIRDGFAVGWWLSDRGPVTGLDYAFVVGVTGIHLSSAYVQEIPGPAVAMVVMDQFGFWGYQQTAMLLNLLIILGVYALARSWLERRVALAATLLAAVMPGLFLNAIYTWPKQAVAYFVLVAAACAWRRRPVMAGAFAALGYLTHPAGVVWLAPLAILLLAGERTRAAVGRGLLRFALAAAVVIAPWWYFTSQVMHAVSRWTTAPLGYLMTDPTHFGAQLSLAWKFFIDHGPLYAIWVRVASTAGSIFPLDLSTPPSTDPGGHYEAMAVHYWVAAHGFSVWGMVGIFLFPFALVALVRHWGSFRRLTIQLLIPGVIIAELANAELYPFANQSMFPLVGCFAIVAAAGLLAVSRRTRWVMFALVALDLLSVTFGGLYRPYGVSAGPAIVFTLIAATGELALLAGLGIALDLLPWPPAALRLRRARLATSLG